MIIVEDSMNTMHGCACPGTWVAGSGRDADAARSGRRPPAPDTRADLPRHQRTLAAAHPRAVSDSSRGRLPATHGEDLRLPTWCVSSSGSGSNRRTRPGIRADRPMTAFRSQVGLQDAVHGGEYRAALAMSSGPGRVSAAGICRSGIPPGLCRLRRAVARISIDDYKDSTCMRRW